MRPRADIVLATGVLTIVFGTALYIVSLRPKAPVEDGPPSTLVTDPSGAQGYFESARGLGIGARRFRRRTITIDKVRDTSRRQLLMLLSPNGISPAERGAVLKYSEKNDVLFAGAQASDLMNCFGYTVAASDDTLGARSRSNSTIADLIHSDSVQVAPPGTQFTPRSPWSRVVLQKNFERTVVDSSHRDAGNALTCVVPTGLTIDTLLISSRGQLIALRLQRSSNGPQIFLVSTVAFFRNRQLRDTDAGLFSLGLIAGKYDEVIFEESHHGGGAGGSMTGVLVAWSRESPWGWMAWQVAGVGLLALLSAAIRFGPIKIGIVRTRRSSLEHVNALAVALSAAKGHDEAVAAMVRGLRRRLSPVGQRARGDWRQWLVDFNEHPGSPAAAASLNELVSLTTPGQPSASVRRAAILVEELWQQLRP